MMIFGKINYGKIYFIEGIPISKFTFDIIDPYFSLITIDSHDPLKIDMRDIEGNYKHFAEKHDLVLLTKPSDDYSYRIYLKPLKGKDIISRWWKGYIHER